MGRWVVKRGDALKRLQRRRSHSAHSFVTDPPYGLSFMQKDWDGDLPDVKIWAEALRVAKPGAYLGAFGNPRTYHRLACHIEDAGWEIRDCVVWLYGSGFPKSKNVALEIDKRLGVVGHRGKAFTVAGDISHLQAMEGRAGAVGPHEPISPQAKRWSGYGTALKPAYEPIVIARKPLDGTIARNALEHGAGGINVDGCRVGTSKQVPASVSGGIRSVYGEFGVETGEEGGHNPNVGRWPANVVLDEEAARSLDAQTGELVSGKMIAGTIRRSSESVCYGEMSGNACLEDTYGDSGGASRFFYVAKASRKERDVGLVTSGKGRANPHPTVKPIALMRWLVRLLTPPDGRVLDPFCGSGSTGCAAVLERFRFTGYEIDPEYVHIAKKRIRHWEQRRQPTLPGLSF